MRNTLTISHAGVVYTLTKRHIQTGAFKWSKKAIYEFTPANVLHSSSREGIAGVIAAKLGMTRSEALTLIDSLDLPEAAPVSMPTQAPSLGYKGIPVRRPIAAF